MRKGLLALLSGNLVGKLIGILREVILAALFGTSAPVGAFRIANTGTFVAVNFFTADAVSVGFLPNYSRLLRENPPAAMVFFRVVQRLLLLVCALVTAVLLFGRDLLVSWLGPGLSGTTLGLAAGMMAIMALAVPFYVYVNLCSYLEIAHGFYVIAATRPAFQSLGLIAGTILAFLLQQPLWLAGGFTISYTLLALWAATRVHRNATIREILLRRPIFKEERRQARTLFVRTILPVLWVPLILQGGGVIERAIASFVNETSVAALDYARLISETAQVLIAAPLGLLMLASLSSLDVLAFRRRVGSVGNSVLLVCVPLSGLLLVASEPLIRVVYGRGAFNEESIAVTASILSGLAVGLWANALAYTHIKALNARSRNRAASIVIATGAVAMVVADLILVPLLGAFGLGLGSSIGAIARLALSTGLLRQYRTIGIRLFQLLPIAAVAVALALAFPASSLPQGLMHTTAFAAASVAWVLVVKPLRDDAKTLLRRGSASGHGGHLSHGA